PHPAPCPPPTTPLSLHDALPISVRQTQFPATNRPGARFRRAEPVHTSTGSHLLPPSSPSKQPAHTGNAATTNPPSVARDDRRCRDRKSTRLNSSHVSISYAVFCL